MIRVIIYARVSSDIQREAGTIEAQVEALEAYAAAQDGWVVTAVERDDGVSGRIEPASRPAMRRVLAAIEAHEVDVLLVRHQDRLSRDEHGIALQVLTKRLDDRGVRLFTLSGEVRFDNPQDRFLNQILGAVAALDNATRAERTKQGRKRAIRQGGRPMSQLPLGYGWSEDRGYHVVEEEASAVRAMFELASSGMGLHRVAQTMKRRGIRSGRTWRGKIGFASNKCVKTVVFRDTYFTGKLSPQRGWMPGFTVDVPPLVSEDLAREARRVLSSSPPPIRRTAHPFLVRGLTRCAHCDLKMGAQAAAAWKYAYYRCRRGDIQPLNQPRCPGRGVRAELVDRMVWDEVCRLIREPGALAHEVEQLVAENEREAESPATALREIDAALEALKQERGRVLRLVRRGLMTDEEVASELDDIRRQQAPLEQRRELVLISRRSKLDRDSRVRVVEDRLAAMRGALDSLTFEQRRAVVMDLVDEVKIDTINKTVQITGIALAPATGSGTDSGSDDHGAAPRGGADGVKPSTAFYGTGMSTTAHHRLVHQGDLALHRRPDGGLEVERWSGRTDAWSPPHVGLERAAR